MYLLPDDDPLEETAKEIGLNIPEKMEESWGFRSVFAARGKKREGIKGMCWWDFFLFFFYF